MDFALNFANKINPRENDELPFSLLLTINFFASEPEVMELRLHNAF